MSRVRVAALVALLVIPSAMSARAVGHPDAEVGPAQTVAAAGDEKVAITADVRPTTVTPGEPVTITVTVRDAARRLAVVDLELYDPVGARAFRRSWGGKASGAGRQSRRQTAWTVPDNARPGDWIVKASVLELGRRRPTTWNEPAIPIFPPAWGQLRAWSEAAARLTVRSASSPVHFKTLPPRATLPSGARCAAWVRAWSFPEGKGVNRTANQRTGHRLGPDFFDPVATDPRTARLAARVDGAFTGTTEQILRWAACKWGVDEDLVRAQAAVESWWRQTTKGDWASKGAACPPGHGLGADGRPGLCPQSYGILQNRYPYARSAWPGIQQSTAMNADTAYAIWRACFEGYELWLNDVDRGHPYGEGDPWGCAGRWFSGRWHTQPAQSYIAKVKAYLADRVWERPDFQEPDASSRSRENGDRRRA